MAISRSSVGRVIEHVIELNAHSATKYESTREVVRATRHGKRDRRDPTQHFVVTIGRPNHRERAFIKQARKAGETFPIRQIQVKFPPVPRKKVKAKNKKKK